MKHLNYFVVSPTYNSQDYILRCLESVRVQQVPENTTVYHVVVNDGSTDGTLSIIENFLELNKNLRIVNHEKNLGTMYSHIDGISECYFGSYDDVIIHLDGDDWFYDSNAILRIHEEYKNPDCLATYGSYKTTNGSDCVCKPVTDNNFREKILTGWPFSHPRTFRRKMFSRIKMKDLKDEAGNLYTSAQDVAIFLPILEMAGKDRIAYIPETLVTYNVDNPLNDHKIRLQDQVRCALSIYKKQRYLQI